MGAIRDNIGKWKAFARGRLYSGSSQGGQNLNEDLQANQAKELDAILKDLVGSAVIGATSWAVVPTVNPLEVKVMPGSGCFAGQRGVTTSEFVVTPQLSPLTVGVQVYIELDDTDTVFDVSLPGWPVRVGWAGPLTAIPANALLLAVITTPETGVIAGSAITDKRIIIARDYDITSGVNDNVALNDIALSLRARMDMVMTRLRVIIGRATWRDDLPGAGLGSLKWLVDRFHTGSDGHRHTGASLDGPRLVAEDIEFTPTIGSSDTAPVAGITADRVQTALEQLDSRKLALNGVQAMTGPLILARDPEQDFEAATKRFVLQRISTVKVTSTGVKSFNTISGVEQSLTVNPIGGASPAQIAISAKGGVVRFEGNVKAQGRIAVTAEPSAPGWSVQLTGRIRFRLYRDGVLLDEAAHPLDFYLALTNGDKVSNSYLYDVEIPLFFDQSPGGTQAVPQARSYDLRWIATNVSLVATPGIAVTHQLPTFGGVNQTTPAFSGRWFATEQ